MDEISAALEQRRQRVRTLAREELSPSIFNALSIHFQNFN